MGVPTRPLQKHNAMQVHGYVWWVEHETTTWPGELASLLAYIKQSIMKSFPFFQYYVCFPAFHLSPWMGYLNRMVTPVHRAQIRAVGQMQKREMVKKSVSKGSNKKSVCLEFNQHLFLFSNGV